MSVYIPGMEMPTSCGYCPLMHGTHKGDECYVGALITEYQKRPDDCPLVPVPPHGRLIDADALMNCIRAHDYPLTAHFNSTDNGMFTLGIQQAVDEAPTIIPADKEEEAWQSS